MSANSAQFGIVNVNDFQQSYVEEGEGEIVVMVPPSVADIRFWDDHREIIASRYRVISMNQRYFGADPWPDDGENFSMQVHADDLKGFIANLDAGPIKLVGTSNSAGVCWAKAALHPGHVKRLFLFEPSLSTFVTDPSDIQTMGEEMSEIISKAKILSDAGDLDGAAREFVNGVNNDDGAFDGFSAAIQAMILENGKTMPLVFSGAPQPAVTAQDLRNISIPVTIALGGRSRIFFQIAAHTANSLIPNSELRIIENQNHFWPLMDPPAFCRVVLDFLDGG